MYGVLVFGGGVGEELARLVLREDGHRVLDLNVIVVDCVSERSSAPS